MTRDHHVQPGQHHGHQEPEPRDSESQGIVRDGRGQEQPADKERAQRVHKTDTERARR